MDGTAVLPSAVAWNGLTSARRAVRREITRETVGAALAEFVRRHGAGAITQVAAQRAPVNRRVGGRGFGLNAGLVNDDEWEAFERAQPFVPEASVPRALVHSLTEHTARVLAELRERGPGTTEQIAARLGWETRRAGSLLGTLAHLRLAFRDGNGGKPWRLEFGA